MLKRRDENDEQKEEMERGVLTVLLPATIVPAGMLTS
jgi:hypothetical protein